MHKILVIRFSSIGDIVLTTPVVRCLKKQLNAEVHFLTKRSFSPILRANPYLDEVIGIEKDVAEVAGQLRAANYTHVIDLHNNLRSWQVRWLLRKPGGVFRKLNLRKWILVNLKLDLMPARHVVDRYLDTVRSLGVRNDNEGLDFFISREDEVDTRDLPPTHQKGYVAFVIGAKHATKQLPADKIIAACRQLGQPVVLVGGREDAGLANHVTAACGEQILNCCGKYNLGQSASLVRQATYVISHDTGLMHIAAAFRKKIVSVWGNTVPALGFTPYMPAEGSRIVEVADLPCRPCSKIGYNSCPQGHFRCMRDIETQQLVSPAEKAL